MQHGKIDPEVGPQERDINSRKYECPISFHHAYNWEMEELKSEGVEDDRSAAIAKGSGYVQHRS